MKPIIKSHEKILINTKQFVTFTASPPQGLLSGFFLIKFAHNPDKYARKNPQ